MKYFFKNFRKRSGITLLILLAFNICACSQEVPDKTIKSKSKDNCLSPYFIVLTDDDETEQLPLKSTEVEVNIAGVIADVEVKQTYSNTGKKPIEAIYIFPASTRAAVYNMIMKIDEREIVAIIEEKQAARKMYENAKNEGKTASLLEEERPNVFQMSVANIMPGAKVEVTLSYTELLIPKDNIYEFVYPTVAGPRYVSENEYETNNTETWTANPYLEEGVKSPSVFDLTMNISTGIPLKELKCETHKNKIDFTGKSNAQLTLQEKDGGNRDFIVQYKLAGNTIESGVLTYEDSKGENFFLGIIQPPERISPESIPPREYIFIVDVSGSMSGFPLEVSKSLMKELLSGLRATDKFNIVLFAGGSRIYAEKSQKATKENISRAVQYMDNLQGGGGTELLNALKNAMNLQTPDNYSRSFVILTDGYVSVEKETFDYIRDNLGNANFFAFGIGSSVNRYIIEGMAHVGMGEPFVAVNQQEAKIQAKRMLKYISSPVLTNIDYKINDFDVYDVLPEKIPDLFASRPIVIAGKFKGSASGNISIHGVSGQQEYNQKINIESQINKNQTKALKYLWAREKIRLLADYNVLRSNDEIRKQIITLGKKYNLLTEYTSFIAIDSEISNHSGNSTTVKQPLPLPQGVSNQAIGRAMPMSLKAPASKRAEKGFEYEADASKSLDLISYDDEEEAAEEEVFYLVEQMPSFNGGTIKDFQNYISFHLTYPKEAIEMGIEGTVFVQFTVDKTGKVTDIKILHGVNELLDKEAIRIIRSSPLWTPGKQRGKPVKVTMVVPVKFKLK